MNQINELMKIGSYYTFFGIYFDERVVHSDETGVYYTFHNEHYDNHYKICHDAAINFINSSPVFSELNAQEIIKMFANIEFKNNRIYSNSVISGVYSYGMQMKHRATTCNSLRAY